MKVLEAENEWRWRWHHHVTAPTAAFCGFLSHCNACRFGASLRCRWGYCRLRSPIWKPNHFWSWAFGGRNCSDRWSPKMFQRPNCKKIIYIAKLLCFNQNVYIYQKIIKMFIYKYSEQNVYLTKPKTFYKISSIYNTFFLFRKKIISLIYIEISSWKEYILLKKISLIFVLAGKKSLTNLK